jgi:hypothetical protein
VKAVTPEGVSHAMLVRFGFGEGGGGGLVRVPKNSNEAMHLIRRGSKHAPRSALWGCPLSATSSLTREADGPTRCVRNRLAAVRVVVVFNFNFAVSEALWRWAPEEAPGHSVRAKAIVGGTPKQQRRPKHAR